MTTDLLLVETGNGGDLGRRGNDLAQIRSFENMIYMAMFGGQVEASTSPRPPANKTEQNKDWWGNRLLLTPAQQFNSQTERMLMKTPLNSAGRALIQNAVDADLQFMRAFAIVKVTVSIIATDVVKINISVREPDSQNDTQFVYIWNGLKLDYLGSGYAPNNNPAPDGGLQYQLQFSL